MTTPRFIYFPQLPSALAATPNEQIACLTLSAADQWISCSLADLGRTEDAQDVYVFLPCLHILHTQVQVPKKQQKHLSQILPFLCEDKLSCDIEDVHLAAGQIQNETVAVRVIQRSLLDHLLDKLNRLGIQPRGLYSDAEPLLHLGGTHLWLSLSRCLLVDQQRVIELPPTQATHLTALLQSRFAQPDTSLDAEPPAPQVIVYRDPELKRCAENVALNVQLEALRSQGCSVDEAPMAPARDSATDHMLLLAYAAQGIELTPQRYTNLLTGPYLPVRQDPRKFSWQPLAWVASVFVGLNLLYLLASGVYFDQRAHQLQLGSEQLYRQYFPQDRRVVNIRAQTQAHLDKSRQGANEGFLNLLGQVHPAWEQHQNNLQLKSLRYHAQRRELLLDLESNTIGQLDQLQQTLGPRAELLSANEDNNNGARGRIKFQGGR